MFAHYIFFPGRFSCATLQTGGREEIYAEYTIGVDDKGVIQGLKVTWYTNGGAFMDGSYGDLDMVGVARGGGHLIVYNWSQLRLFTTCGR